MTSFEQTPNSPLVSQESIRKLDAWHDEITDRPSKEERLRRQNLLATSALADARMLRETEHIIGAIDVEE